MKYSFWHNRDRSIGELVWAVFAFLLPFQTVLIIREVYSNGEKWQYATLGIYLSDIVLAVMGVYVFYTFFRSRISLSKIKYSFLHDKRKIASVLFFVLVLWSFLSFFWSHDGMMALQFSYTLFLGWLAFLIAISGRVSRWTFFVGFVVAMVVHAGIGVVQWITQESPAMTVFGMAEHDPSQVGTSVLKSNDARWLRAYGGFSHPNVFGGALLVAIVFVTYLFADNRRKFSRILFYRGFLLFSGIFFVFATVFTFSRTTWLGVLLVSIIFLGMIFFGKNEFLRRGIIIFGAMVFSAIVCAGVVYDPLFSRFSVDTIAIEGSVSDRREYVKQAQELIAENPIVGVGAGNFTAMTSASYQKPESYIALFQPVHNVPLLIWSELGLVGLALTSIIAIIVMWRVISSRQYIFLIIFFALFPAILLDHWVFSSHFGVFFVSILAGLAMASGEDEGVA